MLAHERSSPPSSLFFLIFNLINLSFNAADQLNPVYKIHKMRSMALWPKQPLLQLMSPTWSTTSTVQRLKQRSSRMNPLTSTRNRRTRSMRNSTMNLSEKELSSPLYTQDREEPANLRQTYHSHEESLLPAHSFFTRTSTGRPVYEPSSDLSQKRKASREMENERIRILFEKQKEHVLAEVRTEILKHELQAESHRRSIQVLTGIIDSRRMEIDHTFTGCEQSRRDQLLLQEEMSEQNRSLRETCFRNMRDTEESKRKVTW